MMDKFVLPNENTESSGGAKMMKYHLKSNFVAIVNPITLRSLTFKITNENGDVVDPNTNFTNLNLTVTWKFHNKYCFKCFK